MTAPLFHLAPGSLDEAAPGVRIRLDGAEGHHAATVMRLGPGEEVLLSDARRIRAAGSVVLSEAGGLTVEVRQVSEEPSDRPRLVLVQALAKGRRDIQAVESATELGVEAVIPWQAERSVARWKPGREAKKHAEWANTAAVASKQTRRTTVPEIQELHTTAQYRQSVRGRDDIRVIVLHETEDGTLRRALDELGLLGAPSVQGAPASEESPERPPPEELHLLVGPEGGISEAEIGQLREVGAVPARLGPTVLRSSTAGPTALAAIQLLLGRWDT